MVRVASRLGLQRRQKVVGELTLGDLLRARRACISAARLRHRHCDPQNRFRVVASQIPRSISWLDDWARSSNRICRFLASF